MVKCQSNQRVNSINLLEHITKRYLKSRHLQHDIRMQSCRIVCLTKNIYDMSYRVGRRAALDYDCPRQSRILSYRVGRRAGDYICHTPNSFKLFQDKFECEIAERTFVTLKTTKYLTFMVCNIT